MHEWLAAPTHEISLDYLAFLLNSEQTLHEDTKCQTWTSLLAQSALTKPRHIELDNYLIHGLLQNDRWRAFLSSDDAAYPFVRLVAAVNLHTSEDRLEKAAPNGAASGRTARAHLREILTEWLAPEVLEEIITSRVLAKHLFGAVWTELVYDNHPTGSQLEKVIQMERPALKAGMLNVDVECLAEDLPGLLQE